MFKIKTVHVSMNNKFIEKTSISILENKEDIQKAIDKARLKWIKSIHLSIEVYQYYKDTTREPSLLYRNSFSKYSTSLI